MVAMAPEGAAQIQGGNWQIFANMIAASSARVMLNMSVSAISRDAKSDKYEIKTVSEDPSTESGNDQLTTKFDKVIIAAPYQFSNIKASDDVIQHAIDEIPYVQLHVTLFTSPFRLNPAFFNLPPATQVPNLVLTTLGPDDKESSGDPGAGKAGFYSISTHQTVVNPKTGQPEHLYKIFSPMEITAEFLSELLGVPVPKSFTVDEREIETNTVEAVSWHHPWTIYSYPKALPRVTFQDPIIGDGLYYTSGVESFISTMETSALMGMNVARLIVDDILGLQTGMDMETRGGDQGFSQEPMEDGQRQGQAAEAMAEL
jgi:prenylcysteine oxidase / farnesylcysteine lyase